MEKNLTLEKPELLCPAKDLEVLKTAVDFGADAVYIGGEAYGLRAKILLVRRRTSVSWRSCALMQF